MTDRIRAILPMLQAKAALEWNLSKFMEKPKPSQPEVVVDILCEKIRDLELSLEREKRRAERIEKERDELREIVYPPLMRKFTLEELYAFAHDENEEGCLELAEFLPQIEAIVNEPR